MPQSTLNNIEQDIIKALAYFDIFSYPLFAEEIHSYIITTTDATSFNQSLENLVHDRLVFKIGIFYSLQNDNWLAERRLNGNKFAAQQMIIAAKAASILSRFPYVKSLAISGSLSKNFADEKTDIDFFIITSANRLWIARSFMHAFKKLSFLVGRQHWFCMNYYIDEAMPEIPEQNIYTAIEIVTLMPMCGYKAFTEFYNNNGWVKNYLPNKVLTNTDDAVIKKGLFARMLERLFDNKLGDRIDNRLMKLTNQRWQKKTIQKRLNENGILMAMKVDKHFSKPDPKNFQDKVLQQYESKIKLLLKKHQTISETTFIPSTAFEMK